MQTAMQTIHVDVRLSPEERRKATAELTRAKKLLEEQQMLSVVSVVNQLITSMSTPSLEELSFEPMPTASTEEVLSSFSATGKYTDAFLKSLEHGLKRLAAAV